MRVPARSSLPPFYSRLLSKDRVLAEHEQNPVSGPLANVGKAR